MGIGDWGLGIGDWGLGPIPNPHILFIFLKYNFNQILNKKYFELNQKNKKWKDLIIVD